jgi:hypothetical protein
MRNISMAVRGHYDDDGYMWTIIIRRFCDNIEARQHKDEEGDAIHDLVLKNPDAIIATYV